MMTVTTIVNAVLLAVLVITLSTTTSTVDAQAPIPTEVCVAVVLPITGEKNLESLRALSAMQMSVEDINKNPNMLPNTKISIIDTPALIDSAGYPTFGAARMYDQIMNRKCANGTSPVVVLGDLSESVCHQMSPIGALLQVPIIGMGARDPSFVNDRNANPYFISFRAGLKDEADAIKALIVAYGWKSFVLWHSDSVFGTALSPSFSGSGLEMVDVPIPATDQGAEAARSLTRILTLRFRVIVVHAEPQLARLMLNLSNRAGMLNGDYIIIGGQAWTQGTDSALTVFNQEEQSYLQGVVGFNVPIPGAAMPPFLARLAARSPLLYPPYFDDGPINTRSIAYDSITAVAVAVRNLTKSGLAVNGPNMYKALTGPGLQYNSWAGPAVSMNAATGSRFSRYILTNFRDGSFQPVGWWTQKDGVSLNPGAQIIWPGNNYELRPSALVPRRQVVLNPVLQETAVAMAVLYGLSSLLLHYLIFLNSEHEVIKASSPIFCHIILAGGDVTFVMAGLSALSTEVTCSVTPSLIAISFSLIFGALVAKTYRIHKIFNSEGLKIKTPSNNTLFAFTSGLLTLDLIVIIAWMASDAPTAEWIDHRSDVTIAYEGCVMNHSSAWTLSLLIPKSVILVFGAYLAYKVRHLNHNFNEAKYISLALYNVLLLSAILFGLITAFPDAVDTVYALKSIGSASMVFVTMLILFGPKFWDIYITKDWVDYHSNSSYVSGVLVHKSSKHSALNAGTGGDAVVVGAAHKKDHPHNNQSNNQNTTGTNVQRTATIANGPNNRWRSPSANGSGGTGTGNTAKVSPQHNAATANHKRAPSPHSGVKPRPDGITIGRSPSPNPNPNAMNATAAVVRTVSSGTTAPTIGRRSSPVATQSFSTGTIVVAGNNSPIANGMAAAPGASGFGLNTRTAPPPALPALQVSTPIGSGPGAGYRLATTIPITSASGSMPAPAPAAPAPQPSAAAGGLELTPMPGTPSADTPVAANGPSGSGSVAITIPADPATPSLA